MIVKGEVNLRILWKISYRLSSKKNGRFNGQITKSVFQVTAGPPTLADCINRQNLTHEFIRASKEK